MGTGVARPFGSSVPAVARRTGGREQSCEHCGARAAALHCGGCGTRLSTVWQCDYLVISELFVRYCLLLGLPCDHTIAV